MSLSIIGAEGVTPADALHYPAGVPSSSPMACTTISVRLLSGKLQQFVVDLDTPTSEISAQLNQNFPPFHETRLYLGDTEICNGSISEANIAPGAEVQAVTTPSVDKALDAFIEACGQIFQVDNETPLCQVQRLINEMTPSLEFLEKHKSFLSKGHCEQLRKNNCLYDFLQHFPSREIGHRCAELVVDVFGRFGDLANLEVLKNFEFLVSRSMIHFPLDAGPRQQSMMRALTNAVKELEARTSKPADERALHLNKHVQGPTNAVAHNVAVDDPTQQVSHELEEAIRMSVADVCAQEGADVAEALLRSKIDSVQQQQLVVLRLTKRNSNVLNALLNDSRLQKLQSQVEEAGCDILPDWAKGGIVLAPLTEQQALEANVQLCAYHIVVSQQDQEHTEQVLAAIAKRRRPVVKLADPEYLNASAGPCTAPSLIHAESLKTKPQCYLPEMDIWDGLWQVERTFVHCPLPRAASQDSRAVQSEPWGAPENSRPLKLPRLFPK